MKKLFFGLALFISVQSFAGIQIISDLDDTIKITNSGDEVDGAINAAFTSYTFTGISEFFEASDYYSNELHILSASPGVLRAKILATLKKNQIQITSLILKNPLKGQSKLDYKVEQMKKLIEKTSDDFILIGDDVGQDPEAYEKISEMFPGRVLRSYIHMIKGRKIPATAIKYWTSFDLFMQEFMAKRMSTSWVEKASEMIVQESKMKMVFPDFAVCPTEASLWQWQTETIFITEARKAIQKIVTYCKARNSSI